MGAERYADQRRHDVMWMTAAERNEYEHQQSVLPIVSSYRDDGMTEHTLACSSSGRVAVAVLDTLDCSESDWPRYTREIVYSDGTRETVVSATGRCAYDEPSDPNAYAESSRSLA